MPDDATDESLDTVDPAEEPDDNYDDDEAPGGSTAAGFLGGDLLIKLIIILSSLGALVSFLSGLIAGVGLPELIIRPVIFAIVMAALAFIINMVITTQVPELVEVSADSSIIDSEDDDYSGAAGNSASDFDSSTSLNSDEINSSKGEAFDSGGSSVLSGAKGGRHKKKQHAGEGEIMVEGVALKDDPAVMAEAVKHLMDDDED